MTTYYCTDLLFPEAQPSFTNITVPPPGYAPITELPPPLFHSKKPWSTSYSNEPQISYPVDTCVNNEPHTSGSFYTSVSGEVQSSSSLCTSAPWPSSCYYPSMSNYVSHNTLPPSSYYNSVSHKPLPSSTSYYNLACYKTGPPNIYNNLVINKPLPSTQYSSASNIHHAIFSFVHNQPWYLYPVSKKSFTTPRVPTASSPANTSSSSSSNTGSQSGTLSTSLSNNMGGQGGEQQLSKTNLYIHGLNPGTTDKELYNMCSQFGTIISTKAILDKNTNKCKGYGFVDFESGDCAEAAVKALQAKGVQAQMAKVGITLLRSPTTVRLLHASTSLSSLP